MRTGTVSPLGMHPPSPCAASGGTQPITVGIRISRLGIPKFHMYRTFSEKENNYTASTAKNAFLSQNEPLFISTEWNASVRSRMRISSSVVPGRDHDRSATLLMIVAPVQVSTNSLCPSFFRINVASDIDNSLEKSRRMSGSILKKSHYSGRKTIIHCNKRHSSMQSRICINCSIVSRRHVERCVAQLFLAGAPRSITSAADGKKPLRRFPGRMLQ